MISEISHQNLDLNSLIKCSIFLYLLESLKIARPRFTKFNRKCIDDIKIAHQISRPWSKNFPLAEIMCNCVCGIDVSSIIQLQLEWQGLHPLEFKFIYPIFYTLPSYHTQVIMKYIHHQNTSYKRMKQTCHYLDNGHCESGFCLSFSDLLKFV